MNYLLPCFIKSRVNEINTELSEIIPPDEIYYDNMELKEFTRNIITKLWTTITKDSEEFSRLGNVIISCYPVTNKDKVLKEYFINNKCKILEMYNEFDKLFNDISKLMSEYHEIVCQSRFLYKVLNYSF